MHGKPSLPLLWPFTATRRRLRLLLGPGPGARFPGSGPSLATSERVMPPMALLQLSPGESADSGNSRVSGLMAWAPFPFGLRRFTGRSLTLPHLGPSGSAVLLPCAPNSRLKRS